MKVPKEVYDTFMANFTRNKEQPDMNLTHLREQYDKKKDRYKVLCMMYGKVRIISRHKFNWLKAGNTIPHGYELHHIDGNRHNDDVSNLMCVSPEEHKKLHEGMDEKDFSNLALNNVIYQEFLRGKTIKHTPDIYVSENTLGKMLFNTI